MGLKKLRHHLTEIFQAGLERVDPSKLLTTRVKVSLGCDLSFKICASKLLDILIPGQLFYS